LACLAHFISLYLSISLSVEQEEWRPRSAVACTYLRDMLRIAIILGWGAIRVGFLVVSKRTPPKTDQANEALTFGSVVQLSLKTILNSSSAARLVYCTLLVY